VLYFEFARRTSTVVEKRNPYATSLTRVLPAARSLDLHHPLKKDRKQQ
jgi:hypothetical protein